MASPANQSRSEDRKITRRAKRAGTWYEGNPVELDKQLNNWLHRAGSSRFGPAKAIISPHAGYEHCGSCAAHAYKEIDPETTSRIFILGPSHYVNLKYIGLSPCSYYETPIGNLTVDREVYSELMQSGLFEEVTLQTDEEEHSLELQLPYIVKVMSKRKKPYTIVPMIVGSLRPNKDVEYGKLLSKYLAQPENVFVISSDFCHWGQRFDYQYYEKERGEIYQSIEYLDKLGMKNLKMLSLEGFLCYQRLYGNTICGRYPICVLLAAVQHLGYESKSKKYHQIKFLNYLQSSRCYRMHDSSVSYVAASLKEVEREDANKVIEDIVDI